MFDDIQDNYNLCGDNERVNQAYGNEQKSHGHITSMHL